MATYERRQLGPYSLHEVLDLTASILAAHEDGARIIGAERARLDERKEIAQRARVASLFSGKGRNQAIPWNEFVRSTGGGSDCEAAIGPEGTPDRYAFYKPFERGSTVGGIYFIRGTLAKAAEANPNLALLEFLAAIAAHELFHYFVDRLASPRPSAEAFGCSCAPYCMLEEAGANFVARESAKCDPAALASFDDMIFKPLDRGGLPGYGEYGSLDDRIVSLIPYFKAESSPHGARACAAPAAYCAESERLEVSPRFVGYLGESLWEAALANARRGEIPFYLDTL